MLVTAVVLALAAFNPAAKQWTCDERVADGVSVNLESVEGAFRTMKGSRKPMSVTVWMDEKNGITLKESPASPLHRYTTTSADRGVIVATIHWTLNGVVAGFGALTLDLRSGIMSMARTYVQDKANDKGERDLSTLNQVYRCH